MLSDIKQSGHGLLQGFANLWWRIVRISAWGYIHLSKHQSSPFNRKYGTKTCYRESVQNGETKVLYNTSTRRRSASRGLEHAAHIKNQSVRLCHSTHRDDREDRGQRTPHRDAASHRSLGETIHS